MDPQTAYVLGALAATVKGVGLAAIGAGIAWWRARRRVRELEAQLAAPATAELERGIEYLTAQVQSLAEQQSQLLRRLPPASSDDAHQR